MPAFTLKPEVLEQYRKLRFDPDARRCAIVMPIGTLFWSDEHPDGRVPRDTESRELMHLLLLARHQYWEEERVGTELTGLWDEARVVLPDWPGFRRLYLSEDDRRAADEARSSGEAFWDEMTRCADEVEFVETDHGVEYSFTFDLRKGRSRPWWKFWAK
jgi:hypothetical protein